jgi:hypothetical protein
MSPAQDFTLRTIKSLPELILALWRIEMTRVFEDKIHVHYSQAYVLVGEIGNLDFYDAFRGQANGLCGAAVRGALLLVTGLHTGQVGFTVDVLDAPPPLDDTWEEIVEVSFFVGYIDPDPIEDTDVEFMDDPDVIVALMEWGPGAWYELPLPDGNYRARYCARGMQLGRDRDTLLIGEDLIDFYSLTFWPAKPEPDCIIKQTSEVAASWHKHAQSLHS